VGKLLAVEILHRTVQILPEIKKRRKGNSDHMCAFKFQRRKTVREIFPHWFKTPRLVNSWSFQKRLLV